MERTGYWTGVDECQATLIQAEMLEEIASETGIAVGNGEHRRNIVTRAVSLNLLVGRRFRIGDVLFEYDRPRPPCGYIQKITERGMTRALGGARGGICVRVIEGGRFRVNDEVVLSE